jgi:hypothetical protein
MGKRIQMVLVSPRLHLGLLLHKENVLVNHQELDRQRGGGAQGVGPCVWTEGYRYTPKRKPNPSNGPN